MNTPLIPDYIHKDSIGKALAFEKCFELLGSLVGN
jgi:hypothetical protein